MKWNKVGATIGSVDLATHQATVTEVRTDAIHLLVKRGRHGELNLAQLVRTPAPPKSRETARERRRAPERRSREKQARRAQPKPPAAPPSSAWTYLIESVAREQR
ncbi:MAG TPA: hypothetical protein VEJ86_14715, partial [Candidatus Binataceae bacterium]|nr:hypothetical protein [Candidatus Binataceae bacterium]